MQRTLMLFSWQYLSKSTFVVMLSIASVAIANYEQPAMT